MKPYIIIETDPPVAFVYPDRRGRVETGCDLVKPWLAGVGAIHRPLSIPGIAPGESANLTVSLQNASGQCLQFFAEQPPLRTRARVMLDQQTGTEILFEGTVTRIAGGDMASMDLESGGARPLSDSMPLRNSTVWGSYKSVSVLPWVYGRVRVCPVQYDKAGKWFLLADHPIQGVDAVTNDNYPVKSFALHHMADVTGQPIALLELAEPLTDATKLVATVRGKMHPETGALLNAPAEIVHDLLNAVGVPVAWSDLDDFRASTAGLVLGGVLSDDKASIRSTLDTIVQSVGGAWSAGMPGVAMLWPPVLDETLPARAVKLPECSVDSAQCQHSDIVTVLRVLFDWDFAENKARQAVQLECPEAIAHYGRIEAEWAAPWLHSARVAEALGTRMLQWRARPVWTIPFTLPFQNVVPGQQVAIQHPRSPAQGPHVLVDAELDLATPSLQCKILAPSGPVPDVQLTRLSSAYDPYLQASAVGEGEPGKKIWTIKDEQGQPIAGAKVWLDGQGSPKYTDSAGLVTFGALSGRHTLLVRATGMSDLKMDIDA